MPMAGLHTTSSVGEQFTSFRLVLVTSTIILCSCATSAPTKEDTIIQERYRVEKKYDLLEKSLQENLSRYEKRRDFLGQLYISMDLGELYSYGLINFRNALDFFHRAQQINEKLRYEGSPKTFKPSAYFRTEGAFTSEREYDYEKTRAGIEASIQYIHRVLGDPTPNIVLGKA